MGTGIAYVLYYTIVERLGAVAAQKGVSVLEAPLTGGVTLAKAGGITMLVGGEKEVFEAQLPLLRKIGGKILLFLVLLLVSKIVARVVSNIVAKGIAAARIQISDLLKSFAINTSRNVVFFLGILFSMATIGIPIGPFLAAFGVVGFVVGFALQDTMSNFASGVMILLYRPYDIGDVVNAGGVTGKVEAQTLVSTTMGRLASSFSRRWNRGETALTLPTRSRSSMILRFSNATAEATGCPLPVYPWPRTPMEWDSSAMG